MRQGDPLSLLLFGLAEDYRSRLLTHLVQLTNLSPMVATREVVAPSYILYTDDVLLFRKAFTHTICCIYDAFAKYGELSVKIVNWKKSFLYTRDIVYVSRHNPLFT